MEHDFNLDVRVAVPDQQVTPQGIASIGTTCWSCGDSCNCPLTTLPWNSCGN